MTSLTDASNNTTSWAFGASGQVIEETITVDSVPLSRSFSYNAAGNLIEKIDRNGRVTKYSYDDLLRQTSEAWYDDVNDTTANLTYSTTYDTASRVASVSDGSTSLSYTYSIFGNLTSQTQSLNGLADDVTFAYSYDAAGRKTSVSAAIGTTNNYINEYDYDALGRIVKVTQAGVTGGNTVAEKRVDFGYGDDGTSSTITRYADLAGDEMVAATDQAFDEMGRIESITHKQADTVFADYAYEWDEASRITEIDMDFDGTSYDDTATYGYDDTSQLTDANYVSQTDEDYSWDATGNQNNTGYSTGDHNRLSTDGTYNYTWDNEGNLIRQTHITSGEYVINTWDHRNRLAKVTNYSASDVATQVVEYAYDANNRMYKRVLDSDGNGTLNTATIFVRCDDQIVMELERSDATAMTASDLNTRQLWHPTQIDHHLAQENISPAKTLWTLPDHLNTVRDVVEYVSGSTSVANHITYDSFGDIAAQSDSGIVLVSYYTGRFQDFATGNRYHRERWTRPSIRIWLSEDPISFAAGDVNLYRYVGNASISNSDPTGEKPVCSGVFYCHGYQKGALLLGGVIPTHWFMKIDGIGYGKFERHLRSAGVGELRDDDHTIYPERSAADTPNGEFYSVCQEILIDDLCYSVADFKAFARDFYTFPAGRYVAGVWDCKRWVQDAVAYGKKMSRQMQPGFRNACHCLNVYFDEIYMPWAYELTEPEKEKSPAEPKGKRWWECGPDEAQVDIYL